MPWLDVDNSSSTLRGQRRSGLEVVDVVRARRHSDDQASWREREREGFGWEFDCDWFDGGVGEEVEVQGLVPGGGDEEVVLFAVCYSVGWCLMCA